MVQQPHDSARCSMCRRKLLGGVSAATVAGLAGCLGDDDPGDDDDDTDVGDDADDNGVDDNGDDDDTQQYADFDPTDPEFPQLAGTLRDAHFHQGTIEFLEAMETREEPRYGDPVLETPEDEDEWIDPDVINFARMAPDAEIPAVESQFEPVMNNIEAHTGKDVEYFPVDSRAAAVEATRSERLHVCLASTGAVPYMVNLAFAVPGWGGVAADGSFGYRLWLATQADNDDINSIADLEGKFVGHVAEASFSGHDAPMGFFRDEGIEPGEDYDFEFSGGHDNSARGVFLGDYDAAPLCSTCFVIWMEEHAEDQFDIDDMKVVWASNPFPMGPMMYPHTLHPDIVDGLNAAFMEEDYEGTSVEDALGAAQFIEIDYATHWDPILTVHEETGVEYEEE